MLSEQSWGVCHPPSGKGSSWGKGFMLQRRPGDPGPDEGESHILFVGICKITAAAASRARRRRVLAERHGSWDCSAPLRAAGPSSQSLGALSCGGRGPLPGGGCGVGSGVLPVRPGRGKRRASLRLLRAPPQEAAAGTRVPCAGRLCGLWLGTPFYTPRLT